MRHSVNLTITGTKETSVKESSDLKLFGNKIHRFFIGHLNIKNDGILGLDCLCKYKCNANIVNKFLAFPDQIIALFNEYQDVEPVDPVISNNFNTNEIRINENNYDFINNNSTSADYNQVSEVLNAAPFCSTTVTIPSRTIQVIKAKVLPIKGELGICPVTKLNKFITLPEGIVKPINHNYNSKS